MVASAASNQTGAAVGAHAFPAIGPAGVVAVRQLVAAAVLLPMARPDLRRMSWAQWWPVLLLGLVFATMNLSLYTAVDRIGLGLAVTLEVLGPLAVALLGSRTRRDLIFALLAGLGVWVLVLPGPSSDWIGIGLSLLSACCWASYIVLNRLAGRRLDGIAAPALGSAVAALLNLPVAVVLLAQGRFGTTALLYAVAAGVLSSVLPYTADLIALRHVSARFFGLVSSVHPVMAALAGLILLGQALATHEWLGMIMIITVNAAAVLDSRRSPSSGQLTRPVHDRDLQDRGRVAEPATVHVHHALTQVGVGSLVEDQLGPAALHLGEGHRHPGPPGLVGDVPDDRHARDPSQRTEHRRQ
ncbi:membrane protein [Actinoplanes sp. NBRC 103695]|nr:membrane protein [Actinoplanes sp. NBRC 103695]